MKLKNYAFLSKYNSYYIVTIIYMYKILYEYVYNREYQYESRHKT